MPMLLHDDCSTDCYFDHWWCDRWSEQRFFIILPDSASFLVSEQRFEFLSCTLFQERRLLTRSSGISRRGLGNRRRYDETRCYDMTDMLGWPGTSMTPTGTRIETSSAGELGHEEHPKDDIKIPKQMQRNRSRTWRTGTGEAHPGYVYFSDTLILAYQYKEVKYRF